MRNAVFAFSNDCVTMTFPFRILSISDSSCIDLGSLERISLHQIANLANTDFENMMEGSVSDARQVLANGYTLPTIMIIKVKGDSGLIGNLLVADIVPVWTSGADRCSC